MVLVSLSFLFYLASRGFKAVAQHGLIYCIVYAVSYIYLRLLRKIRKRRFDLYDVFNQDNPETMTFLVPKEEWALDTPQDDHFLKQNSDGVRCSGVNSKSEFLSVSVSRKLQSRVHCSLVLRLASGNTYYLPEEHVTQKASNEENTFGSARLKMECLAPMRKWRIFFNGMLWEKSAKEESLPVLKHVKFTFSWVASSAIFDYNSDLPIALLAHLAAVQKYNISPFFFIEKLINVLSGYSQAGMFIGRVEVEDRPPEEVYLWGYRNRLMGLISEIEDGRFEEFFVNAENGAQVLLKTLNVPKKLPEFHYGHMMEGNGILHPIEVFHIRKLENSEEMMCTGGGMKLRIRVDSESEGLSMRNSYHGDTLLKSIKARVNDMPAYGISSVGIVTKGFENVPIPDESTAKSTVGRNKLTLSIQDSMCENGDLSGGKGSSLSILYSFSKTEKQALRDSGEFTVPRGVVVTTAAYEMFTSGWLKNGLRRFEKTVCLDESDNYGHFCERIMQDIINADVPKKVVESLRVDLQKIFGEKFSEAKFAVRSSATGEDTEQLSAAGQMETFLGVKGFDMILQALKRCWASQFSFVAVQYKKRYGQIINSPMAVVVQEMVPCDVAGVLFTCDPVSGNPTYITISANYGLGESVVSASSEPDTIVLKRNLKGDAEIHSKQVGSKKTKTVMKGEDGIEEVELEGEESSNCCLRDDLALKLAKIAIQIENHYGNPRDIEWGVQGDKVFLLQSRPITSISIESDFEIRHGTDSYIRREDEYTTKANIGEVFFGSTSPLGSDFMMKLMLLTYQRNNHVEGLFGEVKNPPPYFPNGIVNVCGHCVFIVADVVFRFSESKGNTLSDYTKAMSVGFFGRVVEDEKLFKIATDRHHSSGQKSITATIALPLMMFIAGFKNRRLKKKMEAVQIPVKASDSAEDIFNTIAIHYQDIGVAIISHLECTFSSSLWNMPLLALLAKEEGAWDNNVFSDFAYMMSTCHDVESADVPAGMQHLGYVISRNIKPEDFKKMSPQEALKWLRTTNSEAGTEFKRFMDRHGHRGIKEFDIQTKTWLMDPKPLIEMLQNIVSEDAKDSTHKKALSTSKIISNLHVKLGFLSRLRLRFLLPNCQRCVREREFSKSVLIRQFQKIREAYRLLGKAMVREGRLPNEELVFFLEIEEIRRLLKTRSPSLVSVAFRRWKCHPELDKLIFPEIAIGIPKPINAEEEEIPDSESDLVMTGVPVSQGTVTARACVILSVKEASRIQAGDVLITYATDIGWSPYFPLLSGVVTELGGLVSHGAVVAREYGLPCVVSLHGASRVFKTGDLVQLDGNKGILRRIKPATTEQKSQ